MDQTRQCTPQAALWARFIQFDVEGGIRMAKLKILGDRVLVRAERADVSPGGIVLPETVKEKPQRGSIISVGDGRRDDKGQLIPIDLKEGDEVIFAKYGGHKITVEGEELLILDVDQIYAKVCASCAT
jgi:chaperonin GroES